MDGSTKLPAPRLTERPEAKNDVPLLIEIVARGTIYGRGRNRKVEVEPMVAYPQPAFRENVRYSHLKLTLFAEVAVREITAGEATQHEVKE